MRTIAVSFVKDSGKMNMISSKIAGTKNFRASARKAFRMMQTANNATAKQHATVSDDDDCATFREIAEEMTRRGEPMNHSSVRNHVLRALRKFVIEMAKANKVNLNEMQVEMLVNSPDFNDQIRFLLQEYFLAQQNAA